MAALNKMAVQEIIARALAEDIGAGDITTGCAVDPARTGKAVVIAKEGFVLAGLDVFGMVFESLRPEVKIKSECKDGDKIKKGATIAELSGPLAALLTGERVALNLLQRMSGIATLTAAYVREARGTKARMLDTRKTTPGLRILEKYAVTLGGGHNHRFGLYDGLLIKDNHIAASGGITNAVRAAKDGAPHTLKIEVECRTLAEVSEALDAGADIVMFDNMDLRTMTRAVRLVAGRVPVEASGNMTLERVRAVAGTGVDFISVGALTHSARAVDISMNIKG